MVKDVKRQLIIEKKKNERLQEKMKECFIDTESNHSGWLIGWLSGGFLVSWWVIELVLVAKLVVWLLTWLVNC